MRYWMMVFSLCFLQASAFYPNVCPRYCKCYMWHELRRADCISQKLVNIETDVSTHVQVFDLSHNYIVSLDNRGFQDLGLVHVKYLNLQHNKISSVGLYAFASLKELQLVDLSNNYLQYLHPKTFEANMALRGLHLSSNKLGRALSGSFLDVPTLTELDISRCQFGDINLDLFSELPLLKKLNLSDNQLIRIDVTALAVLSNLQDLDLSLNPWPCDADTLGLLGWLHTHKIQDTTGCSRVEEKLAPMVAATSGSGEGSEESVWSSDIEEVDRGIEELEVRNSPREEVEPIPSTWALLVGFEVGVVLSVFAMYIWLQGSSRLKRGTEGWIELQTPICPDTPPPPYHFIHIT